MPNYRTLLTYAYLCGKTKKALIEKIRADKCIFNVSVATVSSVKVGRTVSAEQQIHGNIIFSELSFKRKCKKAASFRKYVLLRKYEMFLYDSCA